MVHVCALQNACAASLHHFPHKAWIFFFFWASGHRPFDLGSLFEYIASFMNSTVSHHFQPGFLWSPFIDAFDVCLLLPSYCHFLCLYNAFRAFVCGFSICNCWRFYSLKSELWSTLSNKYHFSRKQLPLVKKGKLLHRYVHVTFAQTEHHKWVRRYENSGRS